MRFMKIIPVLDLQRGQVVRARFGLRSEYRPIETPLSPSSDPVDVAGGLLRLYPFQTMYVADLDAIERVGENNSSLLRLRTSFPDLALWVDNGAREIKAARAHSARFHPARPHECARRAPFSKESGFRSLVRRPIRRGLRSRLVVGP